MTDYPKNCPSCGSRNIMEQGKKWVCQTCAYDWFEKPKCPECKSPSIIFQDGCKFCINCGWSVCL